MKKLLAILFLLVVYPAYSQDYTNSQVPQVPLQNINSSGGTNLNLADDGMALGIKLGFEFEFFGNKYDSVNISNNGFLTFTGTNSMCCQGNQLPSFGMDYSISGLWTDLISINNTNPFYKSYELDSNKLFTVGWYGALEFYNTNAPNTFEISLYEGSNNILLNYGDVNIFGHSLTIGLQGDGSKNQFSQIYTGNNANLFDNTSYLFTYIPPEPIQLTPPDCTTNPADISCVIKLNANNVTSEPISYESNRTAVVSLSAQNETTNEQQIIGGVPPDLEWLLSMNSQQTDMSQQEKEEELKDSIEQDILELVLAAAQEPTQDTEQERTNRVNNAGSSMDNDNDNTVQNSMPSQMSANNETTENQSSNNDSALEKDDVQELIASSQTLTEEQIIEQDQGSTDSNIELIAQISQPTKNIEDSNDNSIVNDEGSVDEEKFVTQQIENSNNESTNVEELAVANSVKSSDDATTEDEDVLKIVKDSQKSAFKEEEEDSLVTTTVMLPVLGTVPGMNSTFNIDINTADKERLGLIKPQNERKSDAEKRADQVIAANKDQQDQINKDYMNADQSGILGAIASDTDVTAYRTMMIPQNVSWYKADEIYKNVIYRDNVRGSYFLEKGNTDTYKKMVEEQYKK